jgi:uncharacterized protein
MGTKVFVNLPVADLEKSKAFFGALGFAFNPQFTNEMAACMVISEENFAMLLTHDMFKKFAKKPLADAHKTTGMLIALGLDNKQAVDAMVTAAVRSGGREPRESQDHGSMYSRAFEDLDGHVWEPFWMEPTHGQSS